MKAYVSDRYGPPDVLVLRDLPRPTVDGDRVLVRVRVAALNPYDWRLLGADPAVVRLVYGLRRPRKPMLPGSDMAGVVEAVGPDVTRFRPGDLVYGAVETGGLGEYLAIPEARLAPKPAALTDAQAAAVPVAGMTAWTALGAGDLVAAGQQVLVNGASGGVGHFAVQLAKARGAVVTGVCSTRNVEMVRSIGADHVIDYTREDFAGSSRRYDLVLDTVGNRSLADLRGVLTPRGTLSLVGGGGGRWLGPARQIARAALLAPFIRQRVVRVAWKPTGRLLEELAPFIEAGTLTPVIDRTYPFDEAVEALRHVAGHHAAGKVVVVVDDGQAPMATAEATREQPVTGAIPTEDR